LPRTARINRLPIFTASHPKGFSAPDIVLAGVCAGVCWLGDEPGLVSRRLHLTSTRAANLDDHLDHHWELGFTRRKAEDLYAQAATWMASDISANELARLG
jgi:hypothetical protein